MPENSHDTPLGSNPNPGEPSPPILIEQTYHSSIETCQWKGAKVVIKTSRHVNNPRTLPKWRNEVDVLERLGLHENVTKILNSNASTLAITLRYEPGQSLDKYSDSQMRSTITLPDCHVLWKQMSSALAYLHANSVTHDDVKPENIMWHSEGQRSVLIDFGAALNCTVQPVELFNPSGTPPYVPPEFLQRRKRSAGDVWALGIVMLFALRHISLPDGNWLLPNVFEDGAVLQDMLAWLAEVERLRKDVANTDVVLAEMLEADPESRITSSELVLRLKV